MRRFELSEGDVHKFWQIATSGPSVTVTFGRIGTAGQTKTKDLGSPAAAAREEQRLVREKVGKGYREVTPPSAGASAVAAAPDDQQRAAPEIEAVLQALADIKEWFADRGATPVLDNLAAGADQERISAAEKQLGFALPPELAAIYRVHDGQHEIELGNQFFAYGIGAFLSLKAALDMTPSSMRWFIRSDGEQFVHRTLPSPERQIPRSAFHISRYAARPTELRPDECTSAWFVFAWQDTFSGWINLRSGRVFGWTKDEGLALEAETFGQFMAQFADELWNDKHTIVRDDEDPEDESQPWRWDS